MKRPFDPFAPAARPARAIPFDFVLDELEPLSPVTRPMFGCTAVYVDARILFVLRDKGGADDGVWVAYEPAAEATVHTHLPRLLPIEVIGNSRGWRKLSSADPSFEEDVLLACKLARETDSCIGKLPASRKPKQSRRQPDAASKAPAKRAQAARKSPRKKGARKR